MVNIFAFILVSATAFAAGGYMGPAKVKAPEVKTETKAVAPTLPPEKPTIRIYQLNKDHFRFESCDAQKKCEPIGRDEGYTHKELEEWQKFRPNTVGDMAPLMAMVGGLALVVAAIALAPITIALAAGAAFFAGFAYYFTQSPQVQAGMPNDVYNEFSADPELLPQFKSFLKEVDEGLVTSEKDPRVFSGKDKKMESVSVPISEREPAVPAK